MQEVEIIKFQSNEEEIKDSSFETNFNEDKYNSCSSSETDSLLELSIEEDEIIFIEKNNTLSSVTLALTDAQFVISNYSNLIKGNVAKTIQSLSGCNCLTKLLEEFSDDVIHNMHEEIKDQIWFLEKHYIASKFVFRLNEIIRKL